MVSMFYIFQLKCIFFFIFQSADSALLHICATPIANLNVLETLLKHGANVNQVDRNVRISNRVLVHL